MKSPGLEGPGPEDLSWLVGLTDPPVSSARESESGHRRET
jgi:hypothetical protein